MTDVQHPVQRPLPPGLSDDQLGQALDAFADALGSDKVHTSEQALLDVRDPFALATWDDYTASAVVLPTTVDEVQEVVGIANRFGVPLWTHGVGRNNGYGGPAPRVKGSVIVSLRNMNRVLEIDPDCAYAVVEPGVQWFDLYDAIRAEGHELMVSVTDLGWGSVVGNSLDNGATYLPIAQDMGAACGMEVVLANGEVLRPDERAQLRPRHARHLRHEERGPVPACLRHGETPRGGRRQARLRRVPGPHLDFMDLAAEQYSFGDHAYRRFVERIKDAVDPNGILSPGKQGIWPKAMRNGG